jgi:hypothetical protein
VISTFESTEADEAITLEIVLAKAVFDHLAVKFLHARYQVLLECKVGQKCGEQIEIDPVIAWVGANLTGIDDLG